MQDKLKFYIDGGWIMPVTPKTLDVKNPATEEAYARISLGSKADVDKAVIAARRAFETFSRTTREERLALMQKIVETYQKHYGEVVETISREMGAPLWLSKAAQAATGLGHFGEAMRVLKEFRFERVIGTSAITYEPAGRRAGSSRRGTGRSTRSPARSRRPSRRAARWCSSRARSPR